MSAPEWADVRAAGAVVWRGSRADPEVVLVHRPRYDDWSFPKGKLEPRETMPFAAAREVREETGLDVHLGPVLTDVHYPVPEGRKLVRYWSGRAISGAFTPNEEIDEITWVSPERAGELLSYEHDLDVLERFGACGQPASLVLLVRHAKAGSRSQWDGPDDERPLSSTGREQAQQLTPLLRLFGPERIVSAPPLRCRDTVAPLARELGLPIDVEPMVGEAAYWEDPTAGFARFHELAATPGVTVVSSQGGVMPDVVAELVKASPNTFGVDPAHVPARKGSTWALGFTDAAVLRSAGYYDRPTG